MRGRAPSRRPNALSLAIVLFLIVCGIVLVVAGPGQRSLTEAELTARNVDAAANALERVNQALDAMDYGRARQELSQARAALYALQQRNNN